MGIASAELTMFGDISYDFVLWERGVTKCESPLLYSPMVIAPKVRKFSPNNHTTIK